MINSEGKVFLKEQIPADIFYIDLQILVKSPQAGPKSPETNFTLRFYPINSDTDVVEIQSRVQKNLIVII